MITRIGNIILVRLSGSDSNIYLIGNTVVDAGTGLNFARLYEIFKVLKKDFENIKLVINTHAHFDHIGGNGYFLNAKIAIHESDANILETGNEEKSNAEFFNGKLRPRKVDLKLKDGQIINGLKVIHTPGHTPGSICLYNEKEKILFSGDTIFADGVGRTDLIGGSKEQLKNSLEKLAKLKMGKILPGHGEPVLKNGNKILESISKNLF